jgi:DNA-binding XRE family transcriptional regulator
MDLRELIKEIGYKSDMSQGQIAKEIGCNQATISRIKALKQVPKLVTAQKIVALAKKYKIKIKLDDLPTA